jgi:MFS family permease
MLKELKFSYLFYTIVSMTSSVITPIVMPFWGKFADRYGNLTTIKVSIPFLTLVIFGWACSIFVPTPFLLPYLICVESISGLGWAGFNLCVMNFVYDSVTRERIALCIAYLNILSGTGVLLGTALGSWIVSQSFSISPLIIALFVSGVARLVIIPFSFFVKEVRQPRKLTISEMREKIISLTPMKVLRLLDLF